MSDFPRGRTFALSGDVSPDQAWLVVDGITYDYERDGTKCPLCGGIGIPWQGWFHCEGSCNGAAWIATGEFMLRVPFKSVDHLPVEEDAKR